VKYIIMADGKGTRWNNYNDIPKHFIEVGGETLIARTVRQINELDPDSEVIITSHDPRYEIPGATRYEPKNNVLEIDRFTAELIGNNICFLYGDTYYSDTAIETIVMSPTDDLLFFGNDRSIVAIKVVDGKLFKFHVNRVRKLYQEGKIDKCIGWQVYQSFLGLDFKRKEIRGKFIRISDRTQDYNSPEDYESSRRIND